MDVGDYRHPRTGDSLLHAAMWNRYPNDLVKAIAAINGGEVEIVNNYGWTPLVTAAVHGGKAGR